MKLIIVQTIYGYIAHKWLNSLYSYVPLMGKIPLTTGTTESTMQAREFKLLGDTNLSKATITTYNNYLKSFFNWVPSLDQKKFLLLSDEKIQRLLEDYLSFLKKRVADDEISPNTVPKYFKPFKVILDLNYREYAVKWKPLAKQYPTKEKRSGFKPWTTEQIFHMLEIVSGFKEGMTNYRNKATVLFHSSTGCRVGVHNDPLLMKHLVKMTHPDYDYHFYAILVYADADETVSEKDQRILNGEISEEDYSNFVYLTPEAAEALDQYHAFRKSKGEEFHENTPIFTIVREFDDRIDFDKAKQMSGNAVRHMMEYILARSSIKRQKKRNRYSEMIDHAFRKRFNTIMKLSTSVNANIAEKMMQHKRGLDGSYLKPTREECFREFLKVVPELTVDPNMRLKTKIASQNKMLTEKDEVIEGRLKELEDENRELSKQILNQTKDKQPVDIENEIIKILEKKGLA